ncbi:MAG: AraC family transcriptional regulator [Pseudomonadota bacterium]
MSISLNSYFRVWVLQGLAETIVATGGDVDVYAARFQLPLRMDADVETLVPGERLVRLLETCAVELDCPDFGLRAGAAQGRDALGPIALVALHCATLREAMEAVVRYLNLLNSALELSVQEDEAGPRIAYELKVLRAGPTRQFEEWTLAIALRMLRLIGSDQVRPRAIFFPHAPLLAQSHYTKFFGCPVKFSRPEYGMGVFAADLRRPLLSTDPKLKELIGDYMERIADPSARTLRDQVELMTRRLLPTGRCNLISVAGHFHLSVRTMQRRLEQEGIVFEELLDSVRHEAAQRLLADRAVRLSQIAGLLGYAAQSSFSHAFRRWQQCSPREWRARQVKHR